MRALDIKLRTAFHCPTSGSILWLLNLRISIPILFKFVLCWFCRIITLFVLQILVSMQPP